MGSKVPYGSEQERPLSNVAKSLWEGLWQKVIDPFDPRVIMPTDDQDINGLLSDSLGAYGKVLAYGLDTLEEAFSVQICSGVLDQFEKAKAAASHLSEEARRKTPVLLTVGGEDWQVSPMGAKGGVRFWLTTDWCQVKIRPGQSWGVSIRYSSEALWSYGPDELVARARLWLSRVVEAMPITPEEDWTRVSEVHFATDIYSETFSDEMGPELWESVVAPAGVKAFPIGDCSKLTDAEIKQRIQSSMEERPQDFFAAVRAGMTTESLSCFAAGGKMQTLTVGYRKPCEIQVYDKGREIREASGKEWMLDLWERTGYWARPDDGATPKDVWRIEVRLRGDWMRDRGVVTYRDWLERRKYLLVEALSSRRLTRPNADSNRSRWPAHEMWQLVAAVIGYCDKLAPLGRRFLDTAKQRGRQMIQQAVGCIRAAVVVLTGDYCNSEFRRILNGSTDEDLTILGIKSHDLKQEAKISELIERYRYIPRCSHM